jgi:isopropylmalate/homocitrate/citramalate synthase
MAIEGVQDAGVPVTIESMSTTYKSTWPDEVERTARVGPDVLHLFHAASSRRLAALGMTPDQTLAHVVQSIRHAKTLGPAVVFTPTDTTHIDPAFLADLVVAVQEAGADRVGIADTAGCAYPHGMKMITETVRALVSIPIQTHCHNDLGLALANTLASVEAGASVTDVTVLGLGERAGNASLDEVAVALQVLYGVNTGVKLDALTRLAAEVSEILGVPISVMKPLVGPRAFRHQFGIHSRDPEAFEPIHPAMVGNVRSLSDMT